MIRQIKMDRVEKLRARALKARRVEHFFGNARLNQAVLQAGKNNLKLMANLLHKTLNAYALLSEEPQTLEQLEDKLCARKRHVQRVIKGLRENGFAVKTRIKNRVKYFWIPSDANLLPAVLTRSERVALATAMSEKNADLQSAVHKLVQLVNMQLHLKMQK